MDYTVTLPDDLAALTAEEALDALSAINEAMRPVYEAQSALNVIATAPGRVDEAQQAEEDARGIEPPADGEPWDAEATYRRGAHVTDGGIGYTSIVPFNRGWRPSQTAGHAWVRDTPEPDEPGGIAPWTSGVAYQPGDQVTHDGQTWEAKIAHTSHDGWKPSPATHAVWTPIS